MTVTITLWIRILIFVCSGVTTYFLIHGLVFGAPTVYIPQIRKEANSTDAISMETASWLLSSPSYGSLPWGLILPAIAERYGRRLPYFVLWINTMISVSLFYFSTSVTELLISGILQGMLLAMQIAVSVMVLTEYTSPRYRGIFITFKAATFYWGIWLSNAVGTFFHWKNIGILMFICCIYNITILFWPESPVWLATKGRFEECAKCHRWLKGEDKDSEEELKQLIFSQKENLKQKQDQKQQKNCFIKLYDSVKSKRFYKPLLYTFLTIGLYHFTGKLAYSGYVIDIIKTITDSESSAYEGMLVLDGVTVLGMYIGVSLTKLLTRRTLLLGASSIGVMFLLILSTYLYLVHLNIISANKYLILFILTGFTVTISCGPMIMSLCISSEMTPIKNRTLFLCLFGLLFNGIGGTIIKLFPYIFTYFNSHGAFLFYAIMSSIFIYILYKILPETKDKTILEIEKYFIDENKDNDYIQKEEELNNLKEECENKLLP